MKPFLATLALLAASAQALPISVTDAAGRPLATVMVSRQPVKPAVVDTSDNGYAASGKPQQGWFEMARFTDAAGRVDLPADTRVLTGHGDETTIGDEAPSLAEWEAAIP